MPLLLVRHAVALNRKQWPHADHLRPLTPLGREQATALVDLLAAYGVARILSSPTVRCVDTVRPLAAHQGIVIEELPQLGEGMGGAAAALLEDADDDAVAACTHGDVLPELFAAVAPKAEMMDGRFPCAKGSVWVVEEAGARTSYLPPPR